MITTTLHAFFVDKFPPVSGREADLLSVYLSLDLWSVKEALCLFCRIDLKNSEIAWPGQSILGSPPIKELTITNCQLVNEDRPVIGEESNPDTRKIESEQCIRLKEIECQSAPNTFH